MESNVIKTLIELTNRTNDDVKIAAIIALGEYKSAINQNNTIIRLLELCKDPNREVAISAIKAVSKLSDNN